MTIPDWKQGVVYLRRIDKKGKKSYTAHSCWNTERFIESEHKAALKEDGSVEIVSKGDYEAGRHA